MTKVRFVPVKSITTAADNIYQHSLLFLNVNYLPESNQFAFNISAAALNF